MAGFLFAGDLGFVDLLCAFAQILHGIRASLLQLVRCFKEKGEQGFGGSNLVFFRAFSEKTGGSLIFGAV